MTSSCIFENESQAGEYIDIENGAGKKSEQQVG
jgi:hypothetical protein